MRVRARVSGVVQGVGFRPFVFGLASELELTGFVFNDASGVVVEVEGPQVDAFLLRLRSEAPPLASVESVSSVVVPEEGARSFEIRASPRGGAPDAPISVDTATCDACLAELFDPLDRRYRYPFINCTDCGPRFTIVTGVPYDRPWTTMASFVMCAACQAEYDDPRDRRFHAQPNACPECGPRVTLTEDAGAEAGGAGAADDVLAAAARALRGGAILAVRGIGGFHLACRADDEAAVARLRARKHREERPFALMARDAAMAATLVALEPAPSPPETAPSSPATALTSRARPIVIAPRLPGAAVAPSVAPRTPELGVMLPYSPLHHLLLADVGVPLVMTSGNVSDEPIAFENDDALERLAGIADVFLLHDRPIHTRVDDSVLRGGRIVRRSRGYVPATLPVAPAPPLLAVGAELKSTFALARDGRAWVSHHIGDLGNYETLRSFTDGVAHFERLFAVTPELVACDLHPEYLSTKYALDLDLPTDGVQHHHAHLAACLAEHGVERAAGAIYDGTGYGTDGTVWGGELLRGDLTSFTRLGHLWPVRMPGGEAAIRAPWRMACAWLLEIGHDVPEEWSRVAQLVRSGLNSPLTSSMGRLFDAVAALCGLRDTVTYEGQAAIELEARADRHETAAYPLDTTCTQPVYRGRTPVYDLDARLVLDARPTVAAVVEDVERGVDVALVSARFHNAVANATAAALRDEPVIVLSGGVFQNELLLARTLELLPRALTPRQLPVNDGAIAYGQAAIAARRAQSRTR
ncbi:carbamoyltransferase HypF [Solirubrobacter ginsenosidimutans]|uniref:Carbamoyltransferase n=1 Tax=Solirubrobacter ginsenosidimutans TaxID=490573 RepID=A0A9X3S4W2_9ACTN|nr:carbamoyltransferase HypF [Solirubrobacter ginsenosidimutans]MDA0164882.1 carbamoyltransferase HypF [Solirubrobacter ginsenosidimutans]